MRSGKRALAGVAAGALAAGLIPFALVATATSANAATTTASVTPVRPTGTGASALDIPYAQIAWAGTGNLNNATITLTGAPSGTAVVTVNVAGGDDTVSLNSPTATLNGPAFTTADDTYVNLNVDTAGTYAGRIADGTDTVSFSFTTRGAPTGFTLTPATQNILVGANATLEVSLTDSNGNLTQPQTIDGFAVSDNTDDTVSPTALSGDDLATGVAEVTLATAGNPAGTTTVTATAGGTLITLGSKTATVTKTGSISTNAVSNLRVTSPSTASNAGTMPNKTAQVQGGTSNVTVTIDDSVGAPAGNTIRVAVYNPVGAVNGSTDDTQYFDLTTDSNNQATLPLTLAGGAQTAGNTIVVSQRNVTNGAVGPNIAISLVAPAVGANTTTVSPSGNLVAQVGATTGVTVTVDDSFGNPQAGWIVTAQRIAPSGPTNLSAGTTGADGTASVTVSPLGTTVSGQSETYQFSVINPVVGAPSQFIATQTLIVNYTASGEVTNLSVTPNVGDVVSLAAPTPTNVPAPLIASGGTALNGRVGTTATTTVVNTTTSAVTLGTPNSLVTLTSSQSPATAWTVTVGDGVRVSSTAPSATTLFSGGSNSATIASGGTAYVWATKTGLHDVTVTAGGKTVTAKVFVWNRSTDAYNLALSPAAQNLATGAIGTVQFTTTDMFGNQVAPPTGAATVGAASISGEALFAGFMPTTTIGVSASSGTQTTTVIAGNSAGSANIAAGLSSTATAAAVAGYTPPAGVAAPVLTATGTITVVAGPTAQSILILDGARDGQRIETFGNSTGFEMGALLSPWIRFPGQTGFTQGVAEILVDDEGGWNWGRNTGKRTAVQIRSLEDPSIRSNVVIIPAR